MPVIIWTASGGPKRQARTGGVLPEERFHGQRATGPTAAQTGAVCGDGPPVWLRCAVLPYILCFLEKERTVLAEKMKIIPLGGLNEIGKNMTVY